MAESQNKITCKHDVCVVPGQCKAAGRCCIVTEKDTKQEFLRGAMKVKQERKTDWKPFTKADVGHVIDSTIKNIHFLRDVKGGEYAGDTDALANFRRNAVNLGLNPETIWAVYAGKHWDAISQFVKDLEHGVDRQRAEPITGRIDDLIVYCILLKCLYLSKQEQ